MAGPLTRRYAVSTKRSNHDRSSLLPSRASLAVPSSPVLHGLTLSPTPTGW